MAQSTGPEAKTAEGCKESFLGAAVKGDRCDSWVGVECVGLGFGDIEKALSEPLYS